MGGGGWAPYISGGNVEQNLHDDRPGKCRGEAQCLGGRCNWESFLAQLEDIIRSKKHLLEADVLFMSILG